MTQTAPDVILYPALLELTESLVVVIDRERDPRMAERFPLMTRETFNITPAARFAMSSGAMRRARMRSLTLVHRDEPDGAPYPCHPRAWGEFVALERPYAEDMTGRVMEAVCLLAGRMAARIDEECHKALREGIAGAPGGDDHAGYFVFARDAASPGATGGPWATVIDRVPTRNQAVTGPRALEVHAGFCGGPTFEPPAVPR